MRAGLLANYLASKGHEVTWWTSTFDHTQKKHHAEQDTDVRLPNGVELRMLRGHGYRRNVSLSRVLDHRKVARSFLRSANQAPPPDVIMASFPTIELADAATSFGAKRGIPCVIDIRDLWPDLYAEVLPRWLRGAAAPFIAVVRKRAARVCRKAFAITGNAESFVKWGLQLAGRPARRFDRHFPFAYELPRVADARRAEALRFWAEHGVQPGDGVVNACYFGAIGYQSDFSTLVKAAEILHRRGIRFRVILCGAGARLAELREKARNNPNVILTGWIEQPEILALMELAQVGVAPYWNHVGFVDNLPNKPIEYMAGRMAVVTSLSGFLREFIEKHRCGFHYPQADAAALAALFEKLHLDRPGLEQAAANAFKTYREEFAPDKVHAGLDEYLSSMARSGHIAAA